MVFWLTVMGRVPRDQPLRSVNARLEGMSPSLFAATQPDGYAPDEAEGYASLGLRAVSGAAGVSNLRTRYGDALVALLAVTGLVLLIVCTNLANLFLARGAARAREFAVRRALGATRAHLFRELSIESAVLAAAGAAAGLVLAGTLSRRLLGYLGSDLSLDLSLGGATIVFVVVAAGLSSVIFGLLPAWRASRGGADADFEGLRAGRGSAAAIQGVGLRRGLVVSQVALSFVLVFGALLFTTTVRNLLGVDTGYDSDGVMVARADFRSLDLPSASTSAFKRDLLERVREVPGVASADEVRHVPMGGTGSSADVRGDDGVSVPIRLNGVTDAYLETAGLRLMAGRAFGPADPPGARVVIVTPSFATRVGLGPNPVGKSIRIDTGELGTASGSEFEVIGLVADAKYFNLREEPVPTALVPKALLLDARSYTDIMIRTSLSPVVLREALRTASGDVGSVAWTDVRLFDDTIRAGMARERLLSTVSILFGVLAGLVAAIGLYGVMAQQVTQRRSEIGVRMAFGARRRDILLLVGGHAGVLVGAGTAIGGLLALLASTTVRSFLFGLDEGMGGLLAVAAGVLVITGAVACYLPARRAAGLDPQTALTLD
jgi:predicted permease